MSDNLRPEAVCDLDSFFKFVAALSADAAESEQVEREQGPTNPYGAAHNGWEHSQISEYLFALGRFAKGHAAHNRWPPLPPEAWRFFATVLYGGKLHE